MSFYFPFQVVVYDISQEIVDKALANLKSQLTDLEEAKSLRGDLTADQQVSLISGTTDLKDAVVGCFYVQECVPENLDLKVDKLCHLIFSQCRYAFVLQIKVWTDIDGLVTDDKMILATSTSCILPSKISEGLKHRDQFIVVHPVWC